MSSRKWFIQFNNSVLGPFTSSQLRRMAERSQITPDVKIRVGEDGSWHSATSVKGLFSNEVSQSDSGAIELSSDDISVSETTNSSNPSAESSEASKPEQPQESSSSSFGEMRSSAPPVPGEVPVSGGNIPLGNCDFNGKVPPVQEPKPNVGGLHIPPSLSDNVKSKSSFLDNSITPQIQSPVPAMIQNIIGPDEQVLYSAHPAIIVFIIQFALILLSFLVVGVFPTFLFFVNDNPGGGFAFFFLILFLWTLILGKTFLQWIRASYVITTERTFVKRGIFNVEVAYVYNASIQMLKIRTGLIDQIIHSNTIQICTPAGYAFLRWTPLEVLKFYNK